MTSTTSRQTAGAQTGKPGSTQKAAPAKAKKSASVKKASAGAKKSASKNTAKAPAKSAAAKKSAKKPTVKSAAAKKTAAKAAAKKSTTAKKTATKSATKQSTAKASTQKKSSTKGTAAKGSNPPLGSRTRYTTGKAYPDLSVLKPDIGLAKALYEDYAGQIGEISASMIYLYQNMKLTTQDEKKAAAVMHGIYLVELSHLQRLGEMINRLGADANFAVPGVEKRFWRADMIPYPKTLKAMVGRDLSFEKKTIQSYENTLHRVKEPTVRKTLELILEDERLHVKALEQLEKEIGKRAGTAAEKTRAPHAARQQGVTAIQRATARKNDEVVSANQGEAAKPRPAAAPRAAHSGGRPARAAAGRKAEKRS